MQLKKQHVSIRGALAAATCSVLSQPLHATGTSGDAWDVKTALLFYSEKDRIEIIEPVASASKTTESGGLLTIRAVYDSITGSTPNGATPTDVPQTFTSPSGTSSYTVAANTLPARSINDTRYAFGLDYEWELKRLMTNSITADVSKETDYFSIGASDTIRYDMNNRQTTLAAGAGFTYDVNRPNGGMPLELTPFSPGAAPATAGGENEGKSKVTANVLLGVTQIINSRSLAQFNLTLATSSGYLTDPYKLVSVIGPTGSTAAYYTEKRPDTRTSTALYFKWQYHLPEDVVSVSYRYFSDDWGIKAHTADVKYRYELGGDMYLQPHYRYYQQTAADFYRHSLDSNAQLPAEISADSRLAEMTGSTVGIKFGMPLKDGEFTVRYEQIMQTGDSHPSDAIGIQTGFDLYPDLDASIIQLGYRFKF